MITKRLPDGREATIYPLTFGRARVGVGEPGSMAFQQVW